MTGRQYRCIDTTATCSEGNPLRNLPIEISYRARMNNEKGIVLTDNAFPLIMLFAFSTIKIVKILLILPCNKHLFVLLHKSIIGISIIINGNHNAYMCHSVSIKLIQVSKLALLFQNECFHKQKNVLIVGIMFQMKTLYISCSLHREHSYPLKR